MILLVFLAFAQSSLCSAADFAPGWTKGVPGAERQMVALADDDPASPGTNPVVDALKEGKFPWYDAEADRIRPVWPPRMSWLRWIGNKFRSIGDWIARFFDKFKFGKAGPSPVSGSAIATIALLAALIAFFICLVVLWRNRGVGSSRSEGARVRPGMVARLGDLPEELRPGDVDPWAEAQRLRGAGDISGAIVCLFAHQLLTLDQRGVIRLAPGKTGRQYVQGLRDRDLAVALGATLRLFEDVYYGRRSPTREAFESAWKLAQVFHERPRPPGAGGPP